MKNWPDKEVRQPVLSAGGNVFRFGVRGAAKIDPTRNARPETDPKWFHPLLTGKEPVPGAYLSYDLVFRRLPYKLAGWRF